MGWPRGLRNWAGGGSLNGGSGKSHERQIPRAGLLSSIILEGGTTVGESVPRTSGDMLCVWLAWIAKARPIGRVGEAGARRGAVHGAKEADSRSGQISGDCEATAWGWLQRLVAEVRELSIALLREVYSETREYRRLFDFRSFIIRA